MQEINILSDYSTTNEDKLDAARALVSTYELPLESQQVLNAFFYLTESKNINQLTGIDEHLNNFLNLVFEKHRSLFVAIILLMSATPYVPPRRCLKDFMIIDDNNILTDIGSTVEFDETHPVIGSNAVSSFCSLIDNYEFDIENLNLQPGMKKNLLAYSNEIYGNKHIKPAMKTIES